MIDNKMPLVYIAGPFRGKLPWHVTQNVNAAEKVAGDLLLLCEERGVRCMPVIPHTMTKNFDGMLDDAFWLDGTLELMRRCDASLFALPRENSVGTRGEWDFAERIGQPAFESVKDVVEWATTWWSRK